MQHTIKITFAPPIIPLIYVHGHDLNSGTSLNLDTLLNKNHLNTFIINYTMSLDRLLAHSTSITLCKCVWDVSQTP